MTTTGLIEIDEIERSFLANIDRGEQALAAAENDYQRMEVRDAARAARAVTAIMGRKTLVRQFSILVARAERAIAQANPTPMSPAERSHLGTAMLRGELPSPQKGEGMTDQERWKIRQAHNPLTDEEFESVVKEGADTNTPLTRQQLIDYGREKRQAQAQEVIGTSPRTRSREEQQRALKGRALYVFLNIEQVTRELKSLTDETLKVLTPAQWAEMRGALQDLEHECRRVRDTIGDSIDLGGGVIVQQAG